MSHCVFSVLTASPSTPSQTVTSQPPPITSPPTMLPGQIHPATPLPPLGPPTSTGSGGGQPPPPYPVQQMPPRTPVQPTYPTQPGYQTQPSPYPVQVYNQPPAGTTTPITTGGRSNSAGNSPSTGLCVCVLYCLCYTVYHSVTINTISVCSI